MDGLNTFQLQFMRAIADIQEHCVTDALFGKHDYTSREDELYAITSEVICRIMELFDGYDHFGMGKLNIICGRTGEILKEKPFIELHDIVCDYIKE